MTKGSASVNATWCIDTEEENEGCINLLKCDGGEVSESGWKTSDASWLDMEGAKKGTALVDNVMKAEEE